MKWVLMAGVFMSFAIYLIECVSSQGECQEIELCTNNVISITCTSTINCILSMIRFPIFSVYSKAVVDSLLMS